MVVPRRRPSTDRWLTAAHEGSTAHPHGMRQADDSGPAALPEPPPADEEPPHRPPHQWEAMDVPALLRAARRAADLSQRQLAERAGVPASSIGGIESGRRQVTLGGAERLLGACGWRLVVVDTEGRPVTPPVDDRRDRGGRQYPAHLDVRETGPHGDWWGDRWPGVYGVPPRPVHTFHLHRGSRDWLRRQAAEDAPAQDPSEPH